MRLSPEASARIAQILNLDQNNEQFRLKQFYVDQINSSLIFYVRTDQNSRRKIKKKQGELAKTARKLAEMIETMGLDNMEFASPSNTAGHPEERYNQLQLLVKDLRKLVEDRDQLAEQFNRMDKIIEQLEWGWVEIVSNLDGKNNHGTGSAQVQTLSQELRNLAEAAQQSNLRQRPSGAPRQNMFKQLVYDLADIYEETTGRKAALTWNPYQHRYEGAFLELVSICCGEEVNGKSVKNALNDPDRPSDPDIVSNRD